MRTIKEDYKTYIKNVASFIEKETVQYDGLLNNENIKKEQEDFFREVFHILKSFLNEEDSKKIMDKANNFFEHIIDFIKKHRVHK